MSIREAARMGMIDRNQLPIRSVDSDQDDSHDGNLFVSPAGNQTPAPVVEANMDTSYPPTAPATGLPNVFDKPGQTSSTGSPALFPQSGSVEPPGSAFQSPPTAGSVFDSKTNNPFLQSKPAESSTSSPFVASPVLNPFAKAPEVAKEPEAPPTATKLEASPFQLSFPKPAAEEKQISIFTNPAGPSPSPPISNPFALTPPALPKVPTPAPAPAPAAPSTLFQPDSSLPSSSTSEKAPTVALASSTSMFPSVANPFTALSPFSFSKPAETPQKDATPAAPTPAAPTPTLSSLFKPSGSPPVSSSASQNPFQSLSTSGPGNFAIPSIFPKVPTESQETRSTALITTAPSTLFKTDNIPKDSSTASKNPFGFAQSSFPAAALGTSLPSVAASAASSPLSFSKSPEFKEQSKATEAAESETQPFSFSAAQPAFPAKDSIFTPPKAPEPKQKAEPPATVSPTAKKQPFISSQPSSLPKPTESSIFRSSAPAQVQAPVTESSSISASASAFKPATVSCSPAVASASQSVSSARNPAHSPPQTLFEALRQPKIFDAKSSTYSPYQSPTNQPPLFPDATSTVASDQQGSLKRQHGATDSDASHQHKRRSSLKGNSTAASSDGSLKRSVRFEEASEQEHASSKEPIVSSEHRSSKTAKKKRPMHEQTEGPAEEQGPNFKLIKVSAPEEDTPFKFSVYKAENRPVPKLPILERLEKKLEAAKALCEPRRMTEDELKFIEEARLRRARQVDEDEIALSRARILAEQLKNGPGIFDGWTGPIRQPWDDPNWNPVARILEKYQPPTSPTLCHRN
jgi:hypothetical protein